MNLSELLNNKKETIEDFLEQQARALPVPFYSSVDLRDAGFKFSPIDNNLFPAGFNNIGADYEATAISAIKKQLSAFPNPRIGLIPENHSRNLFYFENIKRLRHLLQKAGAQVFIGSFSDEFLKSYALSIQTEYQLSVLPIHKHQNKVFFGEEEVDLIVLNHDLTGENTHFLTDIKIPILPPYQISWNHRQKHKHNQLYTLFAKKLGDLLGLDPWWLGPLFDFQLDFDFNSKEKNEILIEKTSHLLDAITRKYQEYQIDQKPAVFIKNNRGTYGMGIIVVHNLEDIKNINRKTRNKLSYGKNNTQVNEFLLQEGVPTILYQDQCPKEPVIYHFGMDLAGAFYRVNCNGDAMTNLNSSGMIFSNFSTAPLNDFGYSYSVISRLSVLAAAMEIQEQLKH